MLRRQINFLNNHDLGITCASLRIYKNDVLVVRSILFVRVLGWDSNQLVSSVVELVKTSS